MMKRFIRTTLILVLTASMGLSAQASLAQVADQGCTPNVVPAGQANPSSEIEPLAPIWCFNLTPSPTTRVTGNNDWLDEFKTNVQMARLNDGDMDYRIFDNLNASNNNRTQHFVNNNHWMDDSAGGLNGGAALRPNRSFSFENGKLVVEADIAAGAADYGDAGVWPEITVSMAPEPTGKIVDNLYVYGVFGGYWTAGCRLHPLGNPICSVESASDFSGNDRAPCFASPPSRVLEISDFEHCGSTHLGGNRTNGGNNIWRRCDRNQMDMFCRDRIRIELTKDSLTMYVNGQRYFQDANWPAGNQLPDVMVNGGPVYVYFSDWRSRPTEPVYRFHWGRLAINPHDPDGSYAAASAAPSYCPAMPQNTCDMEGGSMSNPQTMPAMPDMPAMPNMPMTHEATPPSDHP